MSTAPDSSSPASPDFPKPCPLDADWAEKNADFVQEYNERIEKEGPALAEFSRF